MKKTKLKLSRQTVRVLTENELRYSAGGASQDFYCYPTHNGCGASQGPACYPSPTGGWGCGGQLPPIPPPPPSFGPPAQCWP